MIAVRLKALCLATLLAVSCKTSSDNSEASNLRDFDGLGIDQSLYSQHEFWYCPTARSYNIINTYWLAESSYMAYSKRANLDELNARVERDWHSKFEYISSAKPGSVYEPDVQAFWFESQYSVTLAFRGTVTQALDNQGAVTRQWNNLITDFTTAAVPFYKGTPQFGLVHKGFQDALESIWPQISRKLQTLRGTNKPIFLTGHSLGAALATLAAAKIAVLEPDQDIAKKNMAGLFTFGSPPVGDLVFAKEFEAARRKFSFPVLRIRNHDDIVTRAKPITLAHPRAFQHVGSLLYLDDVGYMYTRDASLGLARYSMPAVMAEAIEKIPFIDPADAYSDHSMVGYLRKLGQEYAVMTAAADNAGVARCEFDTLYRTRRR